jgi:hypothetical protein
MPRFDKKRKKRLLTIKKLVMVFSKVKKANYAYINIFIEKKKETGLRSINGGNDIDNDQIDL